MHRIAILTVLVAANCANAADLSDVPQINETKEQRDDRMDWFRDAKFGMFIHWGPCSVGQKEIGWGRDGNRPWDINMHGPRTDDPVYDNYYKQFNPTEYDADQWVTFAKASGMKYMVLITKHHDGFSQFDSKLTNYDIMAGPYKKDIAGALADACHKHGMKLGFYYSTRDWYHPDYLVGDNKKYDRFYRGQIRELLSNYDQVDVMWFDHVGGRDWGKWKFDELFATMYELQPKLIVNNRAARFCGPKTDNDRGPASPDIEKMTAGDYYTPEGRIGSMDIERDWESCIHVGQGWSYRGEDGFKGPDDCIRMLVSCTTGGGNLLLNFGPRPDGTFAEGEVKVAVAMGKWLKAYGDDTEQDHFGQRSAVVEAGIGGLTALACADPALVVACDAVDVFFVPSSSFSFESGSSLQPPAPWEPCMMAPLSPRMNASLPPKALVCGMRLGARWKQATVIPGQLHGRHVASRWELVANNGRGRVGLLAHLLDLPGNRLLVLRKPPNRVFQRAGTGFYDVLASTLMGPPSCRAPEGRSRIWQPCHREAPCRS